jgi:hypothetical protein
LLNDLVISMIREQMAIREYTNNKFLLWKARRT